MAIKKENPLEWIYRAILIAIATATLVKVDRVSVHEQQIIDIKKKDDEQDLKIEKLNDAMFVPAFSKSDRKDAMKKEALESKFTIEYSKANLADAISQLGCVDSFLLVDKSD
jgi:hypothetical protein